MFSKRALRQSRPSIKTEKDKGRNNRTKRRSEGNKGGKGKERGKKGWGSGERIFMLQFDSQKCSSGLCRRDPGVILGCCPVLSTAQTRRAFTNTVWRAAEVFRSRPGKPNQKRGQNEKFMNFAHFCEFWCFSLGKKARFTLNFCSGMPLRKVHELTFLWFGLPGPLLKYLGSGSFHESMTGVSGN